MELEFLELFKSKINEYGIKPVAFIDAGARDCQESDWLSKEFNVPVIAFECNKNTLDKCRKVAKENGKVILIEKAVNSYNGFVDFYPINKEKTVTTWEDGNQGASSLFLANGEYDTIEKYVQDKVTVECTTIESVIESTNIKPNCMWMDLQGAELIALKSMGEYLKNIEILFTEAEITPMYKGQCLLSDIVEYLKPTHKLIHGVTEGRFGTNVIFVRI
jgi:FkbM family methyltransferase